MALSALDCPDGFCHSHHGGHHVNREEVKQQLTTHGQSWCEKVAERTYEIAVDSFSQMVMPSLHQQGWQRRHLDWEFKLSTEPAEVERTVVDGTINALESFLRSREVQRLFVDEVVQGTLAEASKNNLRSVAIRYLIEKEILVLLSEQKEALLDRIGGALQEEADGDFSRARQQARDSLREVEELLLNHAEASA
ncbi:MAG: EF-1 guanine nucleotide exchange domain-containing protein [Cyanobium sp.]|nr:EF-1 guanine nucleotide exchange domain-containing protein [Cyanobacteriota bacterium]